MDVDIQAIIKTLKRKAGVLIYDGERTGFSHGKQQGEEMFALLEMLERAVAKRTNATNAENEELHGKGNGL